MINLGLSHSAADGVIKAEMPFPECGAMSQGYSATTSRTPLPVSSKPRVWRKMW